MKTTTWVLALFLILFPKVLVQLGKRIPLKATIMLGPLEKYQIYSKPNL
jgi:hypothetical protein